MIINADARHLPIANNSIQCVVTSPPYFRLRDYGVSGQIGLEQTPDEYVTHLVAVFREVWRVLKDDGTLWLNLGDSSATRNKGGKKSKPGDKSYTNAGSQNLPRSKFSHGLKNKDLTGIPWMVAFALRADGWYLRSDIIWYKPNPMPESVTDRPTKAHEYIFLLSKSDRYYYDSEAIVEPVTKSTIKRFSQNVEKQNVSDRIQGKTNGNMKTVIGKQWNTSMAGEAMGIENRKHLPYPNRNKRSVWTIATQPCKEAHYAVMPEKLVEPCILAGSKPGDIVFDPFIGSGTVERVAICLGRKAIGTELNYSYIAEIASKRTTNINVMLPI